MASTVLPNGIIIPEKFSRDWYADLYHNWEELDNLLGGGTPKDGTLTIQKNGTTVGTFSANQATDETIDITVPDVNDGTLTIQQNGSTVGTFSANQATDETIDITVPDVNNGTLTIQKNGSTVGTFSANQATDETIDITVPDVNNGTLTIQQNGTAVDTFTANSSSDKTVNIQCVDLTSNQTVGGIKTFTTLISKSSNLERGTVPTTNINEDPIFISADKNNKRTLAFFNNYSTNGNGRVVLYAYNQNTTNYDNIGLVFAFDNVNNNKSIHPVITNVCNLGTSTNKWKSFNGLNPGALSLPRTTGLIDISSSITSLDGATVNNFTPQVDGWLLINGTGLANDGFIYVTQGRIGIMSANNASSGRCAALIPVVAGVQVSVTCKLSVLTWANIVPCQGNV